MVHTNFAGCCHHAGCPCLGADGLGPYCEAETHATEHNTFTPRPEPRNELERLCRRKGVDYEKLDVKGVLKRNRRGESARDIARSMDLTSAIVREVLHANGIKGPAEQPRTRPRQEDRARALDAGISPEEFQAERGEGGRAQNIASLNAWIAERTAA